MACLRGFLALLLLPLLFVLPTAAQAHQRSYGYEHCVVSNEEMELILIREAPNTYSRIEKRLHPGECGVRVLADCRHGFCPVRQGPFKGFAPQRNLAPASGPVYCVARVDRGWTLDLHVAPSKRSRVSLRLADDYCGITLLPVRVGHWTKVRVHGVEGWVSITSVR